jgi:hypothetical protein
MTKNFKRILLFCTVFVVINLAPAFAQPGSADDPLVSKKYVDDQINALRALINQNTQNSQSTQQTQPVTPPFVGMSSNEAPYTETPAAITEEQRSMLIAEAIVSFENAYGDLLRQAAANAQTAPPPQVNGTDAQFFEVVFAEAGKIIYGDSSTEMILRGGSAIVVCGENGVCDVTSGEDLYSGQNVPYNHLVIIPVGDGRGFFTTSDAYLMIKGGYYFG